MNILHTGISGNLHLNLHSVLSTQQKQLICIYVYYFSFCNYLYLFDSYGLSYYFICCINCLFLVVITLEAVLIFPIESQCTQSLALDFGWEFRIGRYENIN